MFAPTQVESSAPEEDAENAGRRQVTVRFGLDSGRYATLVLKVAATLVGEPIFVR